MRKSRSARLWLAFSLLAIPVSAAAQYKIGDYVLVPCIARVPFVGTTPVVVQGATFDVVLTKSGPDVVFGINPWYTAPYNVSPSNPIDETGKYQWIGAYASVDCPAQVVAIVNGNYVYVQNYYPHPGGYVANVPPPKRRGRSEHV